MGSETVMSFSHLGVLELVLKRGVEVGLVGAENATLMDVGLVS